jgi:hypothetical protein
MRFVVEERTVEHVCLRFLQSTTLRIISPSSVLMLIYLASGNVDKWNTSLSPSVSPPTTDLPGAFAELPKAIVSSAMSLFFLPPVCPSVFPHDATQLQLDEFS